MGFLGRLLRRLGRKKSKRESSERVQTDAEEDAARKYWKSEVSADKERRGTPDKQRK